MILFFRLDNKAANSLKSGPGMRNQVLGDNDIVYFNKGETRNKF